MQAEGEPWDQGQGTRCFGAGSHGPGGACVASLLPVLVIVACPHSVKCGGGALVTLCASATFQAVGSVLVAMCPSSNPHPVSGRDGVSLDSGGSFQS